MIHFIEQFLHKKYFIKVKHLAIYRIFFCLFSLLFLGISDQWVISLNPDFIYYPKIGLGSLFHGFPSASFFHLMAGLTVLSYFFILFGFLTEYFSVLLTILIITTQTFTFAFGKVDHAGLLYLCIPITMAFSGWGNTFSIDANIGRKNIEFPWAPSFFAFIVAFAWFTASVPKVIGGWLMTDSHAVLYHLRTFISFPNFEIGVFARLITSIEHSVLAEFLDYAVIFFEAGFLIAVFFPFFFRTFCFSALVFHIIVFLSFNIPFIPILLAYLVFIDWSFVDRYLSVENERKIQGVFKIKHLILITSIYALSIFIIYFYYGTLDLRLRPFFWSIFDSFFVFSVRAKHSFIFIIAFLVALINVYYVFMIKYKKQ